MIREVQVNGYTEDQGCAIAFPESYSLDDIEAIWKAVRRVQAERRLTPYEKGEGDD